ncbi:apiosidase-like domain-containing protein [Paenibacillus sp. MMO-177]|uniref:apiosidase-like domain-containing protein n=1 Tax=Paenibacillus sp. MMO-177 TaxID=3081289 RepID=UPI003018AF81
MNISYEPVTSCQVALYDRYEIAIRIDSPGFRNPFTEVEIIGQFGREEELFTFSHGLPDGELGTASNRDSLIPVNGFCDSEDGSLFRIRFMPQSPGIHMYTISFLFNGQVWTNEGRFEAVDAGNRGLLRVDEKHPFHFVWEGTGEHYFYNGMTAYHLPGIREDDEIKRTLDRFHKHKVNRLRISLSSSRVRNAMAWFEPVYESEAFTFCYGPWVAERPDDAENPGWDITRFDLAYWHKLERIMEYARQRDIVISLIMYVDAYRRGADPYGKPLMGGQDEQRYFRYAAARLSAFPNIMWDLTNEYRLIRPHEWVERMGYYLKACDPYRHLMTCHGHGTFEFRKSGWADFAVYQSWDEAGGYFYMLNNREEQKRAGRIMPQVNEEFGYEDHYPTAWGEGKAYPMRSGDTLRRRAWEIYMAGCYQTSGEYAGNGLGGWVNGRGDDSMQMLEGFSHIVTFFESCDWWRTKPSINLLNQENAYCLADEGELYILYTTIAQDLELKLQPGSYDANWYNPRTGQFHEELTVQSKGQSVLLRCPEGTNASNHDFALRLRQRATS